MTQTLTSSTAWLAGALALTLGVALPRAAVAQASVDPPATGAASDSATQAATVAARPSPPRATYTWTGAYIGGELGSGRDRSNATTTTTFSPTGYFALTSPAAVARAGAQTFTPDAIAFGAHGGFEVQTLAMVIGGEVDYNAMRLSASRATTGTYPCCASTGFTVTQSLRTTYLLAARGRFGVAVGRILLYGTMGLASTHPDYEAVFVDTFATAHERGDINQRQYAPIVGAGVEIRRGRRWSVTGEFLHADFGTISTTSTDLTAFAPPVAFPANAVTHAVTLVLNAFRAGVNVRF